MVQNDLKKIVGWAVLKYIQSRTIVGVGTGSTVAYFIEALASIKKNIKGVVASSDVSSLQLKKLGIPMFNLNNLDSLDIYIDSADEIDNHMYMIKGAGGALTREKILAAVAKKFICIVDVTKQVNILGSRCPLPIEVIPMARSLVARELVRFGGVPKYRHGVITDNGNNILDIYKLKIINPIDLEEKINNIPGVVSVGIFARRCADVVLVSDKKGIKVINANS
ncbi:ribose-5-phosphate isomerase RpiA [Blochmannia endosymbiont of Polyrhachis (Hedomyrma) turneri]|uniref:ribose-5-phosphate isomerase RpiA n=1 Tax=Blochmannia endosymbiont of Polyrhachis (Hedomyrma) turneri TaxID=1505596 RepID=UPI00061A76CA|nr:ribose-5-phosphate isomerase RpiA [Blochmannia endosymbiont of Polyrhachis (Hedomyrma) turneri]AKC59827.1 Ribose-5-phosphate isomerase A [Blochmannia endosymbiont of Polyrhachis (Hedomyrma) turneri]